MDTVAGAIARAIESGIELRLRGEKEAALEQSRLAERLSAMELIKGKLSQICKP
jgi:hypothetical protein